MEARAILVVPGAISRPQATASGGTFPGAAGPAGMSGYATKAATSAPSPAAEVP